MKIAAAGWSLLANSFQPTASSDFHISAAPRWLPILLCQLTLLSLAFAPLRAYAAPALRPQLQSSGDPLVLAFYYTWFDENTWTYDRLSDLPAEPYVSRDRGVMGRHIDQAKAAGIDALLVAWYGPNGDSNQTEPNLAALLDEAAARNFKIGILFETDSPFLGGTDAIRGALQHALTVHANHPAYLRVDGRPVIFFWHPTNYGLESWRAIRGQVDPGYNSIWISEGVNTGYLAVFDGHHLYSNTWNPPSDLNYTDQKFAGLVQQARQQFGAYKFWVATVMPGYNDTRVRPGSGFAKDREGGAYYERSWQAAIDSNPDWIVITSFNEWPEGTYIEPSQAFGNQYLGLTAAGSQRFKGRGTLPIQAAAAPAVAVAAVAVAPPPTPQPEPDTPTAFVQVALLNVRAAPNTEAEILGQITQGQALPIAGRDPAIADWWQVSLTAEGGAIGWVYAPLVRAAGPLDSVPTITTPAAVLPEAVEPATAATTEPPATERTAAEGDKPLSDPDKAPNKPYLSH
ncbi:MAG: endo-1,3-alpha-glucanase family glycosylhydrolase [Caldilineaceae bacterium]